MRTWTKLGFHRFRYYEANGSVLGEVVRSLADGRWRSASGLGWRQRQLDGDHEVAGLAMLALEDAQPCAHVGRD